jgi:hypothetical protein
MTSIPPPPEEAPTIDVEEALQKAVGSTAEPQEPAAPDALAEDGLPPDDALPKCLVANLSVKRALAKYGTAAEVAIKHELQQMLEKGVFEPVPASSKLPVNAIPSFMFVEEKNSPDGTFEKLKARLIAGGHQQESKLAGKVSAPTAWRPSILIVAAVTAKEQRLIATIDIGSAYMNADMTGEVFVRLDQDQTRVLAELEPRYLAFIQNNGTLVVHLRKALYGCLQSALLWNQHLVSTLRSIGFKGNAADLCVLNRGESGADGSQIAVVVNVDDLLVTAYKEKGKQNLKSVQEHGRASRRKVTLPGNAAGLLGTRRS